MALHTNKPLLPISSLDTPEIRATTMIALEDIIIPLATIRRGIVTTQHTPSGTQLALLRRDPIRTEEVSWLGRARLRGQRIVRDLVPVGVAAAPL